MIPNVNPIQNIGNPERMGQYRVTLTDIQTTGLDSDSIQTENEASRIT